MKILFKVEQDAYTGAVKPPVRRTGNRGAVAYENHAGDKHDIIIPAMSDMKSIYESAHMSQRGSEIRSGELV